MTTPPDPIYRAVVSDVQAVCDAWAIQSSPAQDEAVAFLSLIGPAATYKTVLNSIRVNAAATRVTIYPTNAPDIEWHHQVSAAPLENPRFWHTPLPSQQRQHHLLIMPNDQPPEGQGHFIFARHQDDGPAMLGQKLRHNSRLISMREWDQQVWQFCDEQGWLTILASWNIHGWHCNPEIATLQAYLSEMLEKGSLPIPTTPVNTPEA